MTYLKPTPPHDAKTRWLKEKGTEVSPKTLYNYTTAVDQFTDWLHDQHISDMNDVDSETIQQFKEFRLSKVKPITVKNDIQTVKLFIEFCERIQAVPRGLHELIKRPALSKEDEISDDFLTREEAVAILDYLKKYEYASRRHVTLLILWKTGCRLSALRGLDLGDFDEGRPALEIRHRPATGTPLKKKDDGERDVLITPETAEIIADYIEHDRHDVTDDYGRQPLIATKHGRPAATTIQRHVYASTRPCYYTNGACPENYDPEECSHNAWNSAHGCPASVSPHALRRGYVTAARNAGQTKEITGERTNMSGRVLDRHYDKGAHDERAERRRDYLKDI